MKTRISISIVLMTCLALAGCGSGDSGAGKSGSGDSASASTGSGDKGAAKSSERMAFPKDKATATIKGKVVFDGDPPKVAKVRIQGDAYCEGAHSTPPDDESLLVSADKSIKNVFVYVKKGVDKYEFPTPSEPVVLNQVGCAYVPHIMGIMAGQKFNVMSSDATTHNVHFVGKSNREFNHTQKEGQKDVEEFAREEVMARIKCDIHSWMGAYVGVLYHPFYSVTGDQGMFSLGKLPPGEYEIEAWHEKLKTKTQKVTVGDGETKEITFTFGK